MHEPPTEANIAKEHEPAVIRRRLEDGPEHNYLKDFVYGAIDGAVTTFAVVSGVAGAQLSSGVVIILGVANLVGDGFSMAASNFLGTRADHQLREKARSIEENHIKLHPEGEREEVRQIFEKKGFEGRDLERAVVITTSDKQVWVETMLREEWGLSLGGPTPLKAATVTFVAFMVVGVIPLLSYIAQYFAPLLVTAPFAWSTVLTAVAFFAVGATKARFVEQKWYWSGAETLFVGSLAAILAFVIGWMLRGIA